MSLTAGTHCDSRVSKKGGTKQQTGRFAMIRKRIRWVSPTITIKWLVAPCGPFSLIHCCDHQDGPQLTSTLLGWTETTRHMSSGKSVLIKQRVFAATAFWELQPSDHLVNPAIVCTSEIWYGLLGWYSIHHNKFAWEMMEHVVFPAHRSTKSWASTAKAVSVSYRSVHSLNFMGLPFGNGLGFVSSHGEAQVLWCASCTSNFCDLWCLYWIQRVMDWGPWLCLSAGSRLHPHAYVILCWFSWDMICIVSWLKDT